MQTSPSTTLALIMSVAARTVPTTSQKLFFPPPALRAPPRGLPGKSSSPASAVRSLRLALPTPSPALALPTPLFTACPILAVRLLVARSILAALVFRVGSGRSRCSVFVRRQSSYSAFRSKGQRLRAAPPPAIAKKSGAAAAQPARLSSLSARGSPRSFLSLANPYRLW